MKEGHSLYGCCFPLEVRHLSWGVYEGGEMTTNRGEVVTDPWQFSFVFLWRTPCEVFPNSVQGSRFKVQTVRRGGGKGCTLFHWRLHWQCPGHYYRRLTVKGKKWVLFIYFEFVNNIVLTFDLLEGVRETSYSYSNFSVKIIFFSFEPLDPPNMTKTTVGQTIVRRRYTPALWRSRIWTW